MATICDYHNCLEGLYLEYKEALKSSPRLLDELGKKLLKANSIYSLYWSAAACSDSANMTLALARLRTLFTGDGCLCDDGTPGTIPVIDSGTFEDTDLDGSYDLIIVHDLNTLLIASVQIIDPDDIASLGTFTVLDADRVKVSFGASIGAGTFTWIVTGQPSI